MTTPSEFERAVAADFESRGYTCELTGGTNDWGVDVFATKGPERVAIQAKMYAGARPINRRQVFELYGAAAYFDCTRAVLATDGSLREDAEAAAAKLGMEVMRPRLVSRRRTSPKPHPTGSTSFDSIWHDAIMPLAGTKLNRGDGSSNDILTVDWSGIVRRTSGGNKQKVPIEVFRWAIERILESGSITRQEINEEYEGRASSGILLILNQVPQFQVSGSSVRLR